MSREELWNEYFELVYDASDVPEEDYDMLEEEFNEALDSGDVQDLIYNLESIKKRCGVLITLIQ